MARRQWQNRGRSKPTNDAVNRLNVASLSAAPGVQCYVAQPPVHPHSSIPVWRPQPYGKYRTTRAQQSPVQHNESDSVRGGCGWRRDAAVGAARTPIAGNRLGSNAEQVRLGCARSWCGFAGFVLSEQTRASTNQRLTRNFEGQSAPPQSHRCGSGGRRGYARVCRHRHTELWRSSTSRRAFAKATSMEP